MGNNIRSVITVVSIFGHVSTCVMYSYDQYTDEKIDRIDASPVVCRLIQGEDLLKCEARILFACVRGGEAGCREQRCPLTRST
jgi:hypothetical protein